MPPSKGASSLNTRSASAEILTFSSRNRAARVRFRGCAAASQVVQVLQRRQVFYLAIHSKALRTRFPRPLQPLYLTRAVEWLRRIITHVARAESRHIARLFLHIRKCRTFGDIRAGLGWTGRHTMSSAGAHGELTSMQAPSWVYYSFAFGMWM